MTTMPAVRGHLLMLLRHAATTLPWFVVIEYMYANAFSVKETCDAIGSLVGNGFVRESRGDEHTELTIRITEAGENVLKFVRIQ